MTRAGETRKAGCAWCCCGAASKSPRRRSPAARRTPRSPFELELELSPGEKGTYWEEQFEKNTKLERAQIDEITILDGEWFFQGAPTGIACGSHDKQARAGLKACNKDGTHGYGSAQTKAVEVAIGERRAIARAMPGDEIGVQIVVGGGGGHSSSCATRKWSWTRPP